MNAQEVYNRINTERLNRMWESFDARHKRAKQQAQHQVFNDTFQDLPPEFQEAARNIGDHQFQHQARHWGATGTEQDPGFICPTTFVDSGGVRQETGLFVKHPSVNS